ncbi:hypothetical protein C1645_735586 [Glomus cerebriforme]|uniref:Uncharacterized protein n=1 Tax=Glomus cerebriforme TaxID=658196 RepID=A0A397T913_9GLOM|nr:hypothetical protein C1645_735586 [Glomus cerebriforme]
MARRCVKVALANGTNNRRSFSKEKIEAFMLDKRKKNLTIEGRTEYYTKASDFVDIITNHWALDPKSNDENEIVAGILHHQSTFHVKLAEGYLKNRGEKKKNPEPQPFFSMEKNPERTRELLTWIQG